MRAGRPLKAWDSRPRVRPHLEWVRAAFQQLASCRAVGMTLGPIPWTAVDRWARANGVVNRARFEYLIERMDEAFLKAVHEKEKPEGTDGR